MSGTIIIAVIVVAAVVAIIFMRRDRGTRRVGMGSEQSGTVRAARPKPAEPPRQAEPSQASFPASTASPGLSSVDLAEVGRALAANRKIEAIKLVRERTGMGLKDAKEFVEGLQADRRR